MCLAGANTAISEKAADPRPATLILSVVTPFTVIFTVPLFVPGAIVIDWTAESALAPCADVAKEEALEKGKREKTNEVIRKLNEMNLTIEQIAKAVELNEEDVKAILNEKK